MKQTMRQLAAHQRELGLLDQQRLELCYHIGALYNDGRDADSFDRAFELWSEEFQPLLEHIQHHQRAIARLTPSAPRPRVNGRVYPRARRVC